MDPLAGTPWSTPGTVSGFDADPAVPLRELNRRAAGSLLSRSGPVIDEAAFRRRVTA